MENFEYSIQLNDRDWAEFYLASEECRLAAPALATAEDQLLSDPEEGDGEEERAIHRETSWPARESPSRHLLAEDALSASEDETDLGSVCRFLCGSRQALRPSQSLPAQLPSLPLNPPGTSPQLPGPATSSVYVSAAEEKGGAGRLGWPMDPETRAEAPLAGGRDLQELYPRPEMGGSSVGLPLSLSTAEAPEGADGSELQCPQDSTSPVASAGHRSTGSTGNTAVSGKPEFPKRRDAALHPGSIRVSSVLSPASGEAENLGQEVKCLRVVLRTPFQEKHPPSQEHSVQLTPLLANITERISGKEEGDPRPLKTERGADPSRGLRPNTSQQGDQAEDNGVQESPGALEENGSPKPSLGAEARGCATSSGKEEQRNNGEPCLHLGRVTPPEGEYPARVQGSQRLVSHPLKSKDSPEQTLATMTWPEVYDYFFCDDVERPTQEERSGQTSNAHLSELPAISGPEMYEYFFRDIDESAVQEETEVKAGTSEAALSSDHCLAPSDVLEEPASNLTSMGFPEVYEHFFTHYPQDKRSWRQNILAVPASELGKAVRAFTSLVRRPVGFLRSRPSRRGSQVRVMLVSPTLLDGRYPRPENLGVAVLHPERPLQLALTPRDMCLGFVAFASWAMKTSDLRAPDAWKIVLLANFGTLSAIRYFRRHVVTESCHSP